MYELISAYHWDNSKMYELIGITLTVNNMPLRDTGVTLSVISETTYRQTCGKEQPSLFQSKARPTPELEPTLEKRYQWRVHWRWRCVMDSSRRDYH